MTEKEFALIYSTKDEAGKNIAIQIKEIGIPKWAELYEINEDIVFADLSKVKENKVIFLSRHQSAAGVKTLTVHSIGNFSKAEYGGKEHSLVPAMPDLTARYIRTLNEKNNATKLNEKGFNVSYEVTHHGPYTEKSCAFIELGSSKEEWGNKEAGRIIAETIIEQTLYRNNLTKDKKVIGIGGGHYAPDFTKLALRKNYSFGHICPKYALESLDANILTQMIEKSAAEEIILDWKGLKEYKEKVLELCKNTSLPIERVQKLI